MDPIDLREDTRLLSDMSAKLRKLRARREWSRKQVREEIIRIGGEISAEAIRDAEKGKVAPRLTTLFWILKAYGLDLCDFFEFTLPDSTEGTNKKARMRFAAMLEDKTTSALAHQMLQFLEGKKKTLKPV